MGLIDLLHDKLYCGDQLSLPAVSQSITHGLFTRVMRAAQLCLPSEQVSVLRWSVSSSPSSWAHSSSGTAVRCNLALTRAN